jgi:ATP-dependent DNA ligase
MSADKRNFSDFTVFPGEINKTTGSYDFPDLYHSDSNKNDRIWSIKVRLVKGNEKKYSIDWDLMEDNTIPVKSSYLKTTDIPEGTISQMWVETGVIGGKSTRHTPTYADEKHVGQSNERNTFKAGLVTARSLYLKKLDNGMRPKHIFYSKSTKTIKHTRYFPMLVRKYDNEKKNLIYPIYVQPKLDGARCIAYLDVHPNKNPTFENVILYTRQKKDYIGFEKLRKELLPALTDMYDLGQSESAYIDGEFYKHEMPLQTISGAVRNPKRDSMPKYSGIQYHVFDVFYPSRASLSFENRIEHIDDLFASLGSNPEEVVQVPTLYAKTQIAEEKIYKDFLKKKYEGTIVRNATSAYLTHPTKTGMSIRSKFVLKRKMTYSDEYEVVGFEQGTKGRDKGAIIWQCQTKKPHKIFSATPKNITYEERYALYKKSINNNNAGFNKNFKGRMMTVEYEDLSKSNVPLRAKAVGFRDHI